MEVDLKAKCLKTVLLPPSCTTQVRVYDERKFWSQSHWDNEPFTFQVEHTLKNLFLLKPPLKHRVWLLTPAPCFPLSHFTCRHAHFVLSPFHPYCPTFWSCGSDAGPKSPKSNGARAKRYRLYMSCAQHCAKNLAPSIILSISIGSRAFVILHVSFQPWRSKLQSASGHKKACPDRTQLFWLDHNFTFHLHFQPSLTFWQQRSGDQ